MLYYSAKEQMGNHFHNFSNCKKYCDWGKKVKHYPTEQYWAFLIHHIMIIHDPLLSQMTQLLGKMLKGSFKMAWCTWVRSRCWKTASYFLQRLKQIHTSNWVWSTIIIVLCIFEIQSYCVPYENARFKISTHHLFPDKLG